MFSSKNRVNIQQIVNTAASLLDYRYGTLGKYFPWANKSKCLQDFWLLLLYKENENRTYQNMMCIKWQV